MPVAPRRAPTRSDESYRLLASDQSTPSDEATKRPYGEPASTVSSTRPYDTRVLMEEQSESVSVDEHDVAPHKLVSGLKDGGNRGDPTTDWHAITWCAVVYFVITTILNALNCVAFLYLEHMDRDVTPVYSGLHMAATKTGHATGVILFAVYAYSAKCFKKPLLIGRAISFLAFGLYLCIMTFPVHLRRYVFLVAFFFQSAAEGSMIVVRSHIPRVSSKADRQAAYGIVSGAMMFSILGGPIIQITAAALPDWRPLPELEFMKYTYCIYLAIILGVAATVIMCTQLTEPEAIKKEEEESFSEKMATALIELRSMDKVAMAFLFFEKIVTSVSFSALLAAFPPFMQMIVNRDPTTNTMYISASQAAAGVASISIVATIVFSPARRIRSSLILFFALTCYAILYLYSYPWPPISQPIAVWDAKVSPFGCNTTQLEWCARQSHVKLWYWLPPICVLFGLAVPTAMISIDTVYSKLLGNIDQNLMQGALEVVNDIASAIAPVITLKIYTDHGPALFWLVLAGIAIVGFILWLPMVPKMRRLKM